MTERGGGGVFVIDTSSVIEVRRLMSQEPITNVTAVYTRLISTLPNAMRATRNTADMTPSRRRSPTCSR